MRKCGQLLRTSCAALATALVGRGQQMPTPSHWALGTTRATASLPQKRWRMMRVYSRTESFFFFFYFLRTSVQIWMIFMKRDWSRLEREAAYVSSWSQWVVFVLRLKAVSWRDISRQLLHCWSWFDGDRDLHALLFPLMNANELLCQG